MTISSIGSTTNAYQASTQNAFSQAFNDFKNIGSAIQSGDLTSAQNALTAFQSDLQSNSGQNPLSQLFSNNTQLGNDLTALQTALKSNDATGAQTAFKSLVQDMQGAMKTQASRGHHHHHHHVDNDSQSANSTTNSSSSTSDSTTGSTSTGSALNVQA